MTTTYEDPNVSSFNDAMRAEATRIRNTSSLNHAAVSSPNRQRIATIKAAYQQAVTAVRNDGTLSDQGKKQLLARAYTNVSREVAKLAKEDRAAHIKRYDEVEKTVFGSTASNPESALSFRDATDRAAKLEDADVALQALGTAQMSGDATLARAIVMKAWQAGWSNVTDTYAVHNPAVTDQLAELSALRHHLDSDVSTLGGSMGASMRKPQELEGVPNLTKLAEEELPLTANDIFLGRVNGSVTATQEQEFQAQNAATASGE